MLRRNRLFDMEKAELCQGRERLRTVLLYHLSHSFLLRSLSFHDYAMGI
jgi:hypothetical protein